MRLKFTDTKKSNLIFKDSSTPINKLLMKTDNKYGITLDHAIDDLKKYPGDSLLGNNYAIELLTRRFNMDRRDVIRVLNYKFDGKILEDSKFKDEYDDEDNFVIYTEGAYENLLNKAYKGKELADFYEIASLLCDLFDEVYDDLGYSRDTTWFIDPEVLKDNAKMKKLYETLRQRVLDELNSGNIDHNYKLRPDQHDELKKIFKLKYTFEDRRYVKDAEFDEELEEAKENSNNKGDEDLDEEEGKLLNATCKEFLEEYEDKIDKKDPRWYLIQMALDKDKGWAYIKEAKNLKGEVDLDVVTPKNAKTILKESRSSE